MASLGRKKNVNLNVDIDRFEELLERQEVVAAALDEGSDKLLKAAEKAKQATKELNKALDKAATERARSGGTRGRTW